MVFKMKRLSQTPTRQSKIDLTLVEAEFLSTC